MYVALTRARDRLYLAGTIANGKLMLQRGSIGRVLPASLTAAMALELDTDVIAGRRLATHAIRRVPPRARRREHGGRALTSKRLNDHAPIAIAANDRAKSTFC